MKEKLKNNLFQNIYCRIIIAIVGMALLIYLASTEALLKVIRGEEGLAEGFHTTLVLNAIHSDVIASFIPIFTVIPFSARYLEDIENKYALFFLIRSSYRIYLTNRLMKCFLSGGLVASGGALLAWYGAAFTFIPKEIALKEPPKTYLDLLKTIELLFFCGGFWAIVGMALSTTMESKYIAYASPFVLYYLLVILCERYFPDWFLLYPMEWVNPSKLWPLGYWGPAVLMMELTALFSMLFIWRAGRRLREL